MKLPLGSCGLCESEGVKSFIYKTKMGYNCGRGHQFYDDYDLNAGITKEERKKMKRNFDKGIIGGSSKEEPPEEVVSAKIERKSSDIVIDEINKARLETIVGDFSDASSLVGRIFAMQKEKEDIEEVIKRAKKNKINSDDGKIVASGDLEFQAYVPERHVGPIQDMAHSWNCSVPKYMNDRLEALLDDMLFY